MSWLQTARQLFRPAASPCRPANRFRPAVEVMEDRYAPANVTATLSLGVLTLTAQAGNFDDVIDIGPSSDSIPGHYGITGTGTTINGLSTFTAKGVRSIVFDLKGGNDTVTFGALIGGGITFNGGAGTNVLDIGTTSRIGGSVLYLNG